ncbi:MAG: hypothetical protein HDT43_03910 [Ruminococcaceae bacterium]|nr:hypothetical protein [Oscillospiraceae bacterium]
MSNKEKVISLIDNIPDEQLNFIVGYLQNLCDEIEDDMFCEKLYQDYLHSPDKDEFVPIEEVLKGLTQNGIQD